MIPLMTSWLEGIKSTRRHRFVEPFAGGANVGLRMLADGHVGRLTIVELDKCISAFWKVALNEPNWLIRKIRNFKPTSRNLKSNLQSKPRGFKQLGFQTLLRNRTSRGGIIAPRAGTLKRGERDKGPFSRWYPETLARRVELIAKLRSKIELIQGDGLQFLRDSKHRATDIYFIDPPYSYSHNGAGRRLYSHHEVAHGDLLRLSKALSGRFVMTYDNDRGIASLARKEKLSVTRVGMRNSFHALRKELLISNCPISTKRGKSKDGMRKHRVKKKSRGKA